MQGSWFTWENLFGGDEMRRRQWAKRRHRRKKAKGTFAKGRAVIDEALLDCYRAERSCWWCGRRGPVHVHHLFGRGQESCTRFDVPENLVALCCFCHAATHGGNHPLTIDLLAVVAARLKTTQDAIRDYLNILRWASYEEIQATVRPGRAIFGRERDDVPGAGAGPRPGGRRPSISADETACGWDEF